METFNRKGMYVEINKCYALFSLISFIQNTVNHNSQKNIKYWQEEIDTL